MINEHFVFLGTLFTCVGSSLYALDTVRGRTQPNRVTWFFWATIPLIAFSAEIADGVGLSSVMTLSAGLGPMLVFASSFVNKNAYWKLTNLDYACGILSVVAIIGWLSTSRGVVAIALSITADALAAIPTITKASRKPESENAIPFFFGAINSGIAILTIDTWNFATYGFPVYVWITCVLLIVIIKWVHRKPVAI